VPDARPPVPPAPDGLLAALRAVVGEANVVVDADVTAGYERDWTGRFVGRTPAVVRPGSTDEVAAVLAACTAAGVRVVPQGGNTGLVGGSVPLAGEVVLSTRRLDDVGPVDELAAQVTVGAGATLARVRAATLPAGLDVGVDLAARDSATIGGMVATNAGGLRALRHGPMRHQVVGIEAALADGRVVSHLRGLLKDNTGYDLPGLLCGSEGTLAVVTRVRLRLVPVLAHRATALLAVASWADAMALVAGLRRVLPGLEVVEAVDRIGVDLVADAFGIRVPFTPTPAVAVLVECADVRDPLDDLAAALADRAEVVDAAIADDPQRRAGLWAVRERCTDAVATLGVPTKLDVTLPAAELAAFAVDVHAVVAAVAPGARVVVFGHVGDGNLHVNVVVRPGAGSGAPPGPDPGADVHERVTVAVFAEVARRGGSISAEHGIGTAKRGHLHLVRSAEEVAVFRAIRAALDPAGTLNPNVLTPPA
jgi:FAD/FMN-containing dehydrogenase